MNVTSKVPDFLIQLLIVEVDRTELTSQTCGNCPDLGMGVRVPDTRKREDEVSHPVLTFAVLLHRMYIELWGRAGSFLNELCFIDSFVNEKIYTVGRQQFSRRNFCEMNESFPRWVLYRQVLFTTVGLANCFWLCFMFCKCTAFNAVPPVSPLTDLLHPQCSKFFWLIIVIFLPIGIDCHCPQLQISRKYIANSKSNSNRILEDSNSHQLRRPKVFTVFAKIICCFAFDCSGCPKRAAAIIESIVQIQSNHKN